MMKNVAAPLNTLIQPASPMLLLVNRNTEGLSTAIIDSINERDVKVVGVIGKVVRTRHACRAGSNNQYTLLLPGASHKGRGR